MTARVVITTLPGVRSLSLLIPGWVAAIVTRIFTAPVNCCQAQLFQSTKLAEGVGFEPRWVAPRSISSRVAHSRSEQQTPSLRPSPGSRSRQKLVGGLPRGVAVTNAVNGAGNRYFRVRLGKKFTGGRPVVRCFPDLDAAR